MTAQVNWVLAVRPAASAAVTVMAKPPARVVVPLSPGLRTLRNLERDGLVTRTVHAQVPPRVDYTLTATGKSLIPALALAGWAIEHVPHIEASRAAYQTRSE